MRCYYQARVIAEEIMRATHVWKTWPFIHRLLCVCEMCSQSPARSAESLRRSFMRELAAQEGRSQKPDDVHFSWFVDVTQTCFVLFLRPFSAENSPTRQKRKGGRSSPSFVIKPSGSTYVCKNILHVDLGFLFGGHISYFWNGCRNSVKPCRRLCV